MLVERSCKLSNKIALGNRHILGEYRVDAVRGFCACRAEPSRAVCARAHVHVARYDLAPFRLLLHSLLHQQSDFFIDLSPHPHRLTPPARNACAKWTDRGPIPSLVNGTMQQLLFCILPQSLFFFVLFVTKRFVERAVFRG